MYTVQAARGMAALMVVLYSLTKMAPPLEGEPLATHFFEVGQIGCDLFFVVSGFALVTTGRYTFGAKGQTAEYLKRRFFRIYPLYWAYFCAVFMLLRIEPGTVNRSLSEPVDVTASFLLLPQSSSPMFAVAWSLSQQLWCYLVFALMLRASAHRAMVALLGWGAILVCAVVWWPPPEIASLRVILHASSLEFIFGAMAGMTYLKYCQRRASSAAELLMLLIGAASIGYALSFGLLDQARPAQFMSLPRVVTVGGGFALLLLGFALQDARKRVEVSSALTMIGDMSYSLYLSHALTLSACAWWWQSHVQEGASLWAGMLFGGGAFALVLLIAGVSYHLVEKPLLQYCRAIRFSSSPSRLAQ